MHVPTNSPRGDVFLLSKRTGRRQSLQKLIIFDEQIKNEEQITKNESPIKTNAPHIPYPLIPIPCYNRAR